MNLERAVASRLLEKGALVVTVACVAMATPLVAAAQRAPNIDVWFDQGNEFDRGQAGRLMYSGDPGSYVTLLRVNSDGRMAVISPRQPNDRSRLGDSRSGVGVPFKADPNDGVGYVFAVASRTPFDFRGYRGQGNSWNMGSLSQRAGADPFEIVDRFARSSVGRNGQYSIAYAPYEIGRGGAGRMSYQHGVRYDDAYGYAGGYDDPWGASPYRRGYDDYRYGAGRRYDYGNDSRYSRDPRTHSLRHCPDGTLAPYTTPCSAFNRPRSQYNRPQPIRPQPRYALPRPVSPHGPSRRP
jgi:hypothetical protein